MAALEQLPDMQTDEARLTAELMAANRVGSPQSTLELPTLSETHQPAIDCQDGHGPDCPHHASTHIAVSNEHCCDDPHHHSGHEHHEEKHDHTHSHNFQPEVTHEHHDHAVALNSRPVCPDCGQPGGHRHHKTEQAEQPHARLAPEQTQVVRPDTTEQAVAAQSVHEQITRTLQTAITPTISEQSVPKVQTVAEQPPVATTTPYPATRPEQPAARQARQAEQTKPVAAVRVEAAPEPVAEIPPSLLQTNDQPIEMPRPSEDAIPAMPAAEQSFADDEPPAQAYSPQLTPETPPRQPDVLLALPDIDEPTANTADALPPTLPETQHEPAAPAEQPHPPAVVREQIIHNVQPAIEAVIALLPEAPLPLEDFMREPEHQAALTQLVTHARKLQSSAETTDAARQELQQTVLDILQLLGFEHPEAAWHACIDRYGDRFSEALLQRLFELLNQARTMEASWLQQQIPSFQQQIAQPSLLGRLALLLFGRQMRTAYLQPKMVH